MKKRGTRNSAQADSRPEKPTRKSGRKRIPSGGNGRSNDPEPVPKKQKVLERKEAEESAAPESDNSTVEAPVNVPMRYAYSPSEKKKSLANRSGNNDDENTIVEEQLARNRNAESEAAAENENFHEEAENEISGNTHENGMTVNEIAAEINAVENTEIGKQTTAEEPDRNRSEEEHSRLREDRREEGNDRTGNHRESIVPEPIAYYDEDEIMVEHREDRRRIGTNRPTKNMSDAYRNAGEVPGQHRESSPSVGHEGDSESRRTALSTEIAERRKKYMLSMHQRSNSSVHSKTAEVGVNSTQTGGVKPRSPRRSTANDSQNDSRPSMGTGSSGQSHDSDESDDEEGEESPSKSGGKKNKSRKQGDTNRKKYLAIMKEECSGIEKVITKKSVPSAIASSMIDTLYFQILVKSPMSSAVLHDMFKFMLFGKQKKAKKAQCFSSHIGELGTLFRKKVMKNFALHLRKGYVSDAWLGISNNELSSRPEYRWVRHIVPADAICEMVSKVREKKGFSKSRNGTLSAIGLKRRVVNVTDKTEFVLNHTYTTLVSALNVNRKTFKRMFFGRIGYLLTKWADVDFYTVRQDVTGMWLESHDNRKFLRPQELPNTKTLKDDGNIDLENMELFEKVTEERSELILSVQHDVKLKVAKPNLSKSNAAFASGPSDDHESYRSFRRTFSLLGVALRLLSDLCGVPSEKKEFHVLKYHSKSLAVCYCLAIALKQIMLSCSDEVSIGEPPNDKSTQDDEEDGLGPSDEAEGGHQIENEEREKESDLFNHDTYEEMFRMLAIPRSESKGILERYVGNVLESFWKKNHIGAAGQDEGVTKTGQGAEPETGVDVGDVDPESLELDM